MRKEVLAGAADPARVRHYLAQFEKPPLDRAWARVAPPQARLLGALWSGSEALAERLMVHPEWLDSLLTPEALRYPRRAQGLRREAGEALDPLLSAGGYVAALAWLRRFREREGLRIAARDLAQLGTVEEIILELSNVADVCLSGAYQVCARQARERFGQPYHLDAEQRWQPTAFCVLGMGKLGGQELNYSSDVDVLFAYEDEGWVARTPPKGKTGKGLTNHQFFVRLAEAFVAAVGQIGSDAALYRIDLRLRPEGSAGPLVRSLAGYENYYAQWGQTWERMMLIKARCVAGDPELAAEFLEIIQPFRYPRAIHERIFKEIAAVKDRIESEVVKAGELERNVKLGRGGIREIEFLAQSLQVLHAGRLPFLQGSRTLPALQKLADYRLLEPDEVERLSVAYRFLRDVEHRLQMDRHLQTHTIPVEPAARLRLARLMGFKTVRPFDAQLKEHTAAVRAAYDRHLRAEAPPPPGGGLPAPYDAAAPAWRRVMVERGFRDPDKALRLWNHFVHGPGYVHVSTRTTDLAMELLPCFFALCPHGEPPGPVELPEPALSDPDRVLARLDSFVGSYGSRAPLYEIWTANPSLFRLLLLLFDRSEFLAELAIRVPDLLDALEQSGRLRRAKTAPAILEDLRHGMADADQHRWLRRYHQAELMRIGLRDILGLVDFERNLDELTSLAEASLQYACDVLCRKRRFKTAPFAVIGLGKLGGAELIYGSDLDIIFVAADHGPPTARLQALAAEILDLLSAQTDLGTAFVTDTRLRPDGEKGLLVNTLQAHEDYYRHRAQLWEIQTLTRARFVAGHAQVGQAFVNLAARLTDFSSPPPDLAAAVPDWKSGIARMRRRIEKERTPRGQEALAFKTGAGGLVDAEFLAQTVCLERGWHEPNTLAALTRARDENVFPPAQAESLLQNYRHLRRTEGILRRWSYEGEALLPDDPAALYRVAVRCGFGSAERFLEAVGRWRAAVRAVYQDVMPAGE